MYARLHKAGVYSPDADILFGEDIKLSFERESGEMYRRMKVSGTFTFVREAYTLVLGSTMNDLLTLELYTDAGLIATAPFRKGDCEINEDDQKATISPQFVDKYEKLLNGKDNQYNITKIGAESENVEMTKRCILQLYVTGEDKITNIIGNSSYEVDAVPNLNAGETIEGRYHFSLYKSFRRIYFEHINEDLAHADGGYSAEDGGQYILSKEGGIWRLQSSYAVWKFIDENGAVVNYQGHPLRATTETAELDPETGLVIGYSYSEGGTDIRAVNIPQIYTTQQPILGKLKGEFVYSVYVRYIHDKEGVQNAWLRADDITDENLNYRYANDLSTGGGGLPEVNFRLLSNLVTSSDPTEWGQLDNGRYFTKPEVPTYPIAPFGDDAYVVPIGRGQWGPNSLWFVNDERLAQFEDASYNATFTLKDAYTLRSVLKALVVKASDGEVTDVASDFLFSDINPLWPQITIPQKYFVTPITNIKKTYYNQAAQRGDITLGEVLSMVQAAFNCYWHIEETNNGRVLRIEHRIWYYKGGRYIGNPDVEDLTTAVCPLPDKRWLAGTNAYRYALDAPKRVELAWASSCTEYFNGYPIEVKDAYLAKGKTEKRTASNFVTDVDLIIAQPSVFGDDLMTLLHTDLSNKVVITEAKFVLLSPEEGSKTHTPALLQNGFLSFVNLTGLFLFRPFGGRHIEIDGATFSTSSEVLRMKHQTLQFPKMDFDENKLVATDLGEGEIDKVEYDLNTGVANLEILLGI